MASIVTMRVYPGSSIRADFADVLDTVRRGSASEIGDETADREEAPPPAAHASFDFLAALDTVSGQRSTNAQPAASAPDRRYAAPRIEAPEETGAGQPPLFTQDQAAELPLGSAKHEAEPYPEACDPESLASELGLRAGLKATELKRIRRQFALKNHPDRVEPSHRGAATRRMTIANSLIDQALRRAGRDP